MLLSEPMHLFSKQGSCWSMSKKFRNRRQIHGSFPDESPSAEAITVAWLVSCMFTLTGNLGLIIMGTLLAFDFRSERILILAQLVLSAIFLAVLVMRPAAV